jgi:hypothetical protein
VPIYLAATCPAATPCETLQPTDLQDERRENRAGTLALTTLLKGLDSLLCRTACVPQLETLGCAGASRAMRAWHGLAWHQVMMV